jgi:hypothetical protein
MQKTNHGLITVGIKMVFWGAAISIKFPDELLNFFIVLSWVSCDIGFYCVLKVGCKPKVIFQFHH